MTIIVQSLLCVDLLFTAPILLAVGRELVEKSILESNIWFVRLFPESSRNVIRILLVIFILGSSYLILQYAQNAFYLVVSLIGGICGFTLGFIYPPLMYLKVFRNELGLLERGSNIAIIVLGFIMLISSTVFTILGAV